MFWRQRKMNFKNIFILPNVIGDRSRRRFGGIFIKFPKVTSARSSLMCSDIELSKCSRESILAPLSFPAWPCPDGWEAFLAANLSCPVFPYTVSMGEGCRRPTEFMEGVYFLHTRSWTSRRLRA